MQKDTIHKISKKFPDALKNISSHLKSNFTVAGQKALMSTTGTVGLIIKLFGHTVIENYYTRQHKKKLDDYGTSTYMVAGFEQAENSLEYISEKFVDNDSIEEAFEVLEEVIEEDINEIDESEIIMVFQPKYHPAILYVKDKYINILNKLKLGD